MKNKKQNSGFIQIALIIVGALVIMKYIYDIDVVGYLTTGTSRVWLDKIYALGSKGWEKYGELLTKIWNYGVSLVKSFLNKN